jgi:hypothetical protein
MHDKAEAKGNVDLTHRGAFFLFLESGMINSEKLTRIIT